MTDLQAVLVVCNGTDGAFETRALDAAGIAIVPVSGARTSDLVVVAAASLRPNGALSPLIDLLGPLQSGVAALKDGGAVIVVCDDPLRANPEDIDGSAVRAGLVGLCRGLALETRDRAINVNAIGVSGGRNSDAVTKLGSTIRALAGLDVTGQVIATSGAPGIGLARY